MSSCVLARRCAAPAQSRCRRVALSGVIAVVAMLAASPAADAHGPVAPIASSYVARIGSVPSGLRAQVIDGDQRLLLAVPPAARVVVLDNRGAPYLRFTRAGVAVNLASALYYENQTPVALAPPPGLTRATPPRWRLVSTGHSYQWHEGRLHALATVALTGGSEVVGRWSVPLRAEGQPAAISGELVHAPRPPLIWFWPAVVLLACLPALWRLHRAVLDARLVRILLGCGIAAIAVAAAALELHGRPSVTPFQWVKLVVVLGLCGWGAIRLIRGQTGSFAQFVVGAGAVWAGVELLPVLRDGFVLAALPPFVTRVAAVACLGCGLALVGSFIRLVERGSRGGTDPPA